ncbi:MAG: rod shape-determining protein MreC [Nitrospirae bacterium]|nr:rod shape-determining protein MreC [Nitrospirota bacterium]
MLAKKWTQYFVYILFTIILMTYQNIKGPLKPFYYLSIPLSYPINYINSAVYSFVDDFNTSIVSFFTLRQEYLQNTKALNDLKIKEQLFKEIQLENIRLQSLLDFKSTEEKPLIVSRIIAKSEDKWSDILILDKGISDGVQKDMPVRSINGLVGKVLSSNKHFSRLNLITDKNFSVAVRLQTSRLSAILSGTGSNNCILKYIPDEETVTIGDKVITSGLDTLFPEGIPVGEVKSVNKSNTGLFQEIAVKPYEDPHKLEEIIIIVNTEQPYTSNKETNK